MSERGHGGDIYKYQIKNKEEIIDFSANINPLGICEGVRAALHEAIYMVHNYPDPNHRKLKQAISEYEDVSKEQIVCGNGAADIIFRLVYSRKPKKALLLAPTFSEYEEALKSIDCEIIYYRLKEENEFEFKENIVKIIDKTFDMVWICNPNNPTGKVASSSILQSILDECEKKDILLVIDECFNDFLDNPEEYSLKNKIDSPNLLILKAFTKMYAIPGVRLGYAMSDPNIIKQIEKTGQAWSVSGIAQHVGCAAVKETAYVQKTRSVIKKERIYLEEELRSIGFKVYSSKANYILFKSYHKIDLMKKLQDYNILIRSCENYNELDETYYRIAVRTEKENKILIDTLKQICLK